MRILHLALASDWESARDAGAYEISTRGLTLAEVGFVHAATADQLPGVAQRFYAEVAEPLVLLVLEAAGSPVRWERTPEGVFPHVHGPVPVAAVVAVRRVRL
ncbi:MAG TPA: DUF952 domain-containing protein [Actinomycetales bacterium]|nr:DUF952 domain-containing protein [Actinomycetales bacterium]